MRRRRFGGEWAWRLLVLGLLLAVGFSKAHSAADQVARYKQALTSLEANDWPRFRELAERLETSPLHPYAEYAGLRQRIESVAHDDIAAFLVRHPDLPITATLRVAWLREHARREDWPRLIATYDGERDVYVRCALVQARLAVGERAQAVEQAKELWRVGHRQPQPCIPAFDFLERIGALTPALVGERIRLALRAGDSRLAAILADRLPQTQRHTIDNWLAVYRSPQVSLDLPRGALGPAPVAAEVVTIAMERLARRDPVAAQRLWPEVAARYDPPATADATVRRTAALYAVYNDLPQGAQWLAALPARLATPTVHAWRVRRALRYGDWAGVAHAVEAMPDSQRNEAVWQYWRAQALQRLGRSKAARPLYEAIAGEFSYYGFLAADALGSPYHWGKGIEPPNAARQRAVAQRPAARRAFLLHQAGEYEYAHREWRALIAGLNARERLAAARIAIEHPWPWATLYASASASVANASFLLFPKGYWDDVRRSATAKNIAAPWLLALIRQESAFRRGACSRVGACGLVQLMPDTARWLLEREGRRDEDVNDTLTDPARSIEAGAGYLAYLHQRFEHPVLALAAYNAGPGNVGKWLKRDDPPPGSPRWVETLLYGETREYLKAVLFNRVIYQLRLEGETARLASVLRPDEIVSVATLERRLAQDAADKQ